MWSHILRRLCGALQKLEEFNRKASVRSIAGRAGGNRGGLPTVNRCVVRVPCGCRAVEYVQIASVHDEDDLVGHDVQVVSGVAGE